MSTTPHQSATPQVGDTWEVGWDRSVTIRSEGKAQETVILRCDRAGGWAWAEARMPLYVWLDLSAEARHEYLRLVAFRASYAHELPQPPDRQERINREWWPAERDRVGEE